VFDYKIVILLRKRADFKDCCFFWRHLELWVPWNNIASLTHWPSLSLQFSGISDTVDRWRCPFMASILEIFSFKALQYPIWSAESMTLCSRCSSLVDNVLSLTPI
jgi:hypothetical protein